MDSDEIISRLARIEGKLDGIEGLAARVRQLELWQAWLKGGWTALVAAWLYLFRKVP
jgi:hypothetical protein